MIFLRKGFSSPKYFNRVPVALAHLLAVQARHHRRLLANPRFGQNKGRPVGFVELDGNVARDLHMLLLVAPDGHDIRIINQNIGRHQHRIRQQAVIRRKAARDFVLVTVAPFQQAHRRDGGENPGKLRHLRHIGLPEQKRPFRVQTAGQKIQRHVPRVAPPLLRVEERRHRMIIGDEIKGLALLLQLDGRLHHAKVVSQVQRP